MKVEFTPFARRWRLVAYGSSNKEILASQFRNWEPDMGTSLLCFPSVVVSPCSCSVVISIDHPPTPNPPAIRSMTWLFQGVGGESEHKTIMFNNQCKQCHTPHYIQEDFEMEKMGKVATCFSFIFTYAS